MSVCAMHGDALGVGTAHNNIANCYLQTRQLGPCHSHLMQVVKNHQAAHNATVGQKPYSQAERLHFLNHVRQSYKLITELYLASNHPETALTWCEKGKTRSFLDALNVRAAAESIPDASAASLRELASEHTAVVVSYALVSRGQVSIWAVTSDSVQHFQVPWPAHVQYDARKFVEESRIELEQVLSTKGSTSRSASRLPLDLPSLRTLTDLYDTLIRPVHHCMPLGANNPVIVIPQGPLFYVPWPALFNTTKGRFLIEDHAIAVGVAASVTIHNAAVYEVPNPSAIAVYDSGLPLAAEEAAQVAASYGVEADDLAFGSGRGAETIRRKRFAGATLVHARLCMDGNEGGRRASRGNGDEEESVTPNPEHVHMVQLHGSLIFTSADLVSPAILGSGQATTSDSKSCPLSAISKWDLKSCQLLVLNTTGVWSDHNTPDTDMLLLAREIMAAGARGCILSQWPTDGEESMQMFATFHAERAADKKPGAFADARNMRKAMMQVMPHFGHWLHWAAWCLYK
eukprot:NODE_303_length_1940_cov_21.111052_g253_i0.p1 GENE.NODE_303_length_1940_cov_21.111052_g253_i0~~NODE_303_length_1940_cov_21.111052_g253_i0.p1  ORF type:complete len:515 (-),score=123.71 NODE_303_length_1940_cov_21.111052_g253_i0:178-1722(-)